MRFVERTGDQNPHDLSLHKEAGTSAPLQLISSGFAYAGKLLSNPIDMLMAATLIAATIPCTYLGAMIVRRAPPRFLRVLLGVILAMIAAQRAYLLLTGEIHA